MKWVSLQMISLGSLLIFNDHTSSSAAAAAAAAKGSRCISKEALENRTEKLWRNYWGKVAVSPQNQRPQGDARTCAKAAEEMSGDESRRSVSPWTYRIDHNDSRFPPTIPMAECLCEGCIINGRINYSYNSMPVFAPLVVLRKTRCPDDPNKYLVTKEYIRIPVACTCVVPSYAE